MPPHNAGGYVSVYYSDDLASVPVRWVTKPGDNKSDPNLETLTYGLFSTCGPSLRSGIVNRRFPHLFFVTNWSGRRVLSGFYEIGWFAKANSGRGADFHLAARDARFVQHPIPLSEVDKECGTDLSKPFRSMRLLNATHCRCLTKLLKQQPNAIDLYRSEIDRLERFNLKYTGNRCWGRTKAFEWSDAAAILPAQLVQISKVINSSVSGKWKCKECGDIIRNKALLRVCPSCQATASLVPAD